MLYTKTIEILLVEDDLGDIRLTQEAFKEGTVPQNLEYVMDGDEAILYLTKQGDYAEAKRPNLILLDLNLPKKDGREVLQFIKSNDDLRKIPVIILSTSNAKTDIDGAYNLFANSYITKPVDFQDFITLIKDIENFWLTTASIPETA